MTPIAEYSQMVQELLGQKADELAKSSGFIQRQRQVTGAGFAQALILGGLAEPDARRQQIHQPAAGGLQRQARRNEQSRLNLLHMG